MKKKKFKKRDEGSAENQNSEFENWRRHRYAFLRFYLLLSLFFVSLKRRRNEGADESCSRGDSNP